MSSALETLRRDFGGDIIEPGGADYESVSRTLLTSGKPAYVLRPGSVRDVQEGVMFAAGIGLSLSVRGGGHSFPGFGTNDGGVVIDLSRLASVEIIDSERHLVRIGGGATWGKVAAALAPHGLAISSGDTKSVGVGGLTLTGGIGWKVRKHGLALDNVVAAEVVTASGEVVPASAAQNPELFWAIRGGGGNFGIVTSFDFVAHPTTDVFYGTITFPPSEAATVIQGWADYLRTAPDELTSTADLANPFRGPGHRSRSTSPSTVTTRNSRPRPSTRSAGSARCSTTMSRRDPTRTRWRMARPRRLAWRSPSAAPSSTGNRYPRSSRSWLR
jgi:FAD/FMN-containing dehydrogenase